MTAAHFFLMFDGLLLASAYQLSERNETAAVSVLAFAGVIILWQIFLFATLSTPNDSLRIERKFRKPHIVQALVQLCVYLYWGLYWDDPARYAIYIGVQVLCAYSLELMLSFSKRKVWNLGFGPIPIVLSLNLFIWFREEYFYFQILMVSVTYFAKEFLTWTRDGRTRHIFNPSAFALTVAAVALLSTHTTNLYTTGVDIVESFELPPSFYEEIFVLGLVVQFLFLTTPITFGAVLAHFSLYQGVSWMIGGRAAAFPIDRSIFLAMTLLIPDPATTPKSATGKLLFGGLYGAAVFATAIGLKYFQQPDYFSKILVIPVLNLLTPWFDRISPVKEPAATSAGQPLNAAKKNLIGMLIYSCLFLGIIGSLKRQRTTALGREWLMPVAQASNEMRELILNLNICQNILPDVYRPFGILSEIENYALIKKIYRSQIPIEELERMYLETLRRSGKSPPPVDATQLPDGTDPDEDVSSGQ